MELTEQVSELIHRLVNTHKITELCVAYSGGIDSHVLLKSVALLSTNLSQQNHPQPILLQSKHFQLKVRAIHINHGLSDDADSWQQHCKKICESLGIEFNTINVNVVINSGESPEAVAREARYDAFRSVLRTHECLLTAHHQDDQAETLLLQLLRGSGPQGLASMPEIARITKGYIARPLLSVSREQICEFAQLHKLSWVEDGSNQELSYNRNYLRQSVIPLLKKRWPAFSKTVSRSAQLCAQAQQLIEKEAQAGLQVALLGQQKIAQQNLSVSALNAMDEIVRTNVIRYWIKKRQLPMPTRAGMQQIITSVLNASKGAMPLVTWSGCEIRRYQDQLFAMQPLPKHASNLQIPWDLTSSIKSDVFGQLSVRRTSGKGIKYSVTSSKNLKIAFRQGGETYCEYTKVGTRPVKKLFQELAIPPWLRDRIPLIYDDKHLIAIADIVVCAHYKASSQESAIEVIWTPVDSL